MVVVRRVRRAVRRWSRWVVLCARSVPSVGRLPVRLAESPRRHGKDQEQEADFDDGADGDASDIAIVE